MKEIFVGDGSMKFEVIGITEDRKKLIVQDSEGRWMCMGLGSGLNAQRAVNIAGKELPLMKQVKGRKWEKTGSIKPIKITEEMLEEAVFVHLQIRDKLAEVLRKANYEGQGKNDAEEMREHFDIACIAMARYAEVVKKQKEWDDAREKAERTGRKLMKCPKCKRPTTCKEYGDREVYSGSGNYKYYATCEKCGKEFLVNTY